MESFKSSIKIRFGFGAGSIIIVTGLAGFKVVSIRFSINFTNLIILVIGFGVVLIGLGMGLIAAI